MANSDINPAPHPFDAGIALEPISETGFRGTASPHYWNEVGPFGGMTAAVMLNAVLVHPKRLGDPVAITINYAAPMARAGFTLETRIVRTTRTTQHWTLEIIQEGQSVVTATSVFATRRETWARNEIALPAQLPDADDVPALDRGSTMPWFRQYELRPVRNLGSSADPQVHTHAWIRDLPPRSLDYAALASICDSVMPWMFRRRKQAIPVSTVSLSVYFHTRGEELARVGEQMVYTRSYGQVCHAGFMDSNAQVWSRDGVLLATTQQMMWVRE